jgi:hypothetical protein
MKQLHFRNVRGEDNDALDQRPSDQGGCQPAFFKWSLFLVLADAVAGEDSDVVAAVGGAVGFEQQPAMVIKTQLQRIAASRAVDDGGIHQVFLGEKGPAVDGHSHSGDLDDHHPVGVGRCLGTHGMEPEFGVMNPVLAAVFEAGAAHGYTDRQRQKAPQIPVEANRTATHTRAPPKPIGPRK